MSSRCRRPTMSPRSPRWPRRPSHGNTSRSSPHAAEPSGRHRGRWLWGCEEVVLAKGRDHLRIVIGGRDRVFVTDLLDRTAQQCFPIGADEPYRAAASAIAFENDAPDRLPGARLRDPPRREQRDDRETPLPRLGVGERDERSFAERVAAIAGHDMQQIVHLAVALAEPDTVVL